MRKLKFKNVKELYGGETEVLKPKLISVLKESFGLDEADCPAPLNMGSFNDEKEFGGGHFSSGKLGWKEESETCNACAPSCSPCVHSEHMASLATNAIGFSGEACKEKDSNRCSFNDADLSSPRLNTACNDGHTSSETSHPLSACLSRESFSENAESEENLRDCNTSEGTKMITKPNLCRNSANNSSSLKAPVSNIVPNQLGNQKESECLGDNIGFICGSDFVKARDCSHNSDANKRNMSSSSASINRTEKAVNAQRVSSGLVGSPLDEVDYNLPRRSSRSNKDYSQEIVCCSNKSDLSEISSLRDSCVGASSAKGERSESSEEQVQSSFARADALRIHSQIGDEHNSAESMQTDTGINEREKTTELKSTSVVKEPNIEEAAIRSQPVSCADGSDSIEYEVKICDICGDIGREELLAVCSKCNDGAEHIYCMRVKLEKVPKGDWMCEECMFSTETKKQKQDKVEEGGGDFKISSTSVSETKGMEVMEREAYRVGSTRLFSSKKPAGTLQVVRKRPFEENMKSPSTSSSCSKNSVHQSRRHFSSTVCSPTESSSKSPKFPSQPHVSKGLLFKSKSFSATSSKEDVQLLKEGSCRKQGFAEETAASDSKRGVRMMSKSASLKNMRSYGVNNSNPDVSLLPNCSRGEDLKRSRYASGQHSTKTEKKLRLAKSNSFASVADKRIAPLGRNILQHPSSSSHQDPSVVKGHEKSDNTLKNSSHSAQGGSASSEKKRAVNARHRHIEYSAPANTNHSNANVIPDEQPCPRDSSVFPYSIHMPSWISAVPQLDCTWQGKFEIQRSGGLSLICGGIQAHLSTYASHNVVEAAEKLPQKLLLEEVPRLSMWPTQFTKTHATEDNIALYFFAEDLESYERSYQKLLDRMIKKDSSLKGNFGGVDLLIFTSNHLPEKSQRWNNLLFLWGVFRGKKGHCSGQIPSASASASERLLPRGKSSESIPAPCNSQPRLNPVTSLNSQAAASSGRIIEVCEPEARLALREQKSPDSELSCGGQQVGGVDHHQMKNEKLLSRADSSSSQKKGRPEIDLNISLEESEEPDCTEEVASEKYPKSFILFL